MILLATILRQALGLGETYFDHLRHKARYPMMVFANDKEIATVTDMDNNLFKVRVDRDEMLSYVVSVVGDPDINGQPLRIDDEINEYGIPIAGGSIDIDSCSGITFSTLKGVTLIGDYDLIENADEVKKQDFCYMAGLIYNMNCTADLSINEYSCEEQVDCNKDSDMMAKSYDYGIEVDYDENIDPLKVFDYKTYQAHACEQVGCGNTYPKNNGCVGNWIVIFGSNYWWYWTIPAVFAFFLLVAILVWCTGFCCMAMYNNPEQKTAKQYKYIYKKKKDKKGTQKVIHIHVNANPENKNQDSSPTYVPNKSSDEEEATKNIV